MSNKSQNALIRDQLETKGIVSRNWLLKKYITRGAARIKNLKDEGMKIVGGRYENDYIYTLVS